MGRFGNIESQTWGCANSWHSFGAVIDEGVFEELLQQAFYGL